MAQPTTVVFDIGNVLLRWDPRNLYRKHLRRRGADGVVPRQRLHDRLEHRAGSRPRLGRGGGASRQGSSRARDAHPRLPRALARDRLRRHRGQRGAPAAPARGRRAELLHHQFLRSRSSCEAQQRFPFLVGLRRHHRLGRRAPPEARSRDLPAPARPLRPEGGATASSSTIPRPMWKAARAVGMHAIHYVEPMDLAAELRGYGFPV